MTFQSNRISFCDAQQFEQQAQQIAIVLRFPFRPFHNLAQILKRGFDRRAIIADRECADRGPTNHDHLIGQRGKDNTHLSASQKVSAKDRDEDKDDTE